MNFNKKINFFYYSLFIIHHAFGLTGYSFSQSSYFQQAVNYEIHVSLNDSTHELNAFETIEYYNNSPDELKEIYFHLWPNAYKNTSTAHAKQQLENGETKFYYSKENERGYIDQLEFKVNGQNINWKYDSIHIDICLLTLNTPLKQGEHITITTPFHVKIPNTFSRLGHIGESYQITQWYPKPAVYDRYGWHPIPYLNQGEFYSEFGSFDVHITLPKNYVVGATGDLINGENEIAWLDEIAQKTKAIEVFDNKDLAFPASDNETKTLHYHQENIHDFAWFADKRFHVLKGEVELPHSKRKVTTWAMFTNIDAKLWIDAISYINDAVYYYSLWNGDYPYNQVTALESALSAGGGMEYPNVTVIGRTSSAFGLEQVIMHEVGHNWFYGILGSNEREHAWLDEGINSYNESRYIATKYPEASLMNINSKFLLNTFKLKETKHKESYYLAYLFTAKLHLDQPLSIKAPEYWSINYGAMVYCKTAAIFDYMQAYLGSEEMDKIMQEYFNDWKFKHPYPEDIRQVFETSTPKKLDWFFDDLIGTTKKLDYKIVNRKTVGDSIQITIKNTGNINGPVVVGAYEKGAITELKWYEGFKGKQTVSFPKTTFFSDSISGTLNRHNYSAFKIDPYERMPEINRNNNTIKARGLFKKFEPIQFQWIGALNNPNKTQLFYTPVVGWNYHNGLMPGIALYNQFLFPKPVQFTIMPLYSVKTNNLAGSFKIAGNLYTNPSFFIHSITLAYKFSRFAFDNDELGDYYYEKNDVSALLTFKKPNARSAISSSILVRNIFLMQLLGNTYLVQPYVQDFYSVIYQISNRKKINPWQLKIGIEPTSKYVKSSLEALYKISFKGNKKGIDFRFFAGKFLYENSTYYGNYNFRMSGWNGAKDYLYDNIFLGRSIAPENMLSQQMVETDGGFKTYSAAGESNNWLTALNIKIFPPYKLPIGLFADIGFSSTSDRLMYDVGIQLALVKDVVDIYFPIKVSQQIQDYWDANGYKYLQTIRFTLNINRINVTDSFVNSFR